MSAERAVPAAPSLPDTALVADRLAGLRQRMTSVGVDPARIEVVAVTKGFPPEVVGVATGAGLHLLGENYAQDLLSKVAWLGDQPSPPTVAARRVDRPAGGVQWHFIGRLQRNKVRQLTPHMACFQSVDRSELVDELGRRAPGCRLLVQVNTTGEAQKGGCRPDDVGGLVDRAMAAGLMVEGLMTVGPTAPAIDPAPSFGLLRRLVDRLGLQTCSMGMTDDLEIAVREGSTMIRVGRALFGPRPLRGDVGN
jgi:pyridoxal phosphate enzyme (YggS family)